MIRGLQNLWHLCIKTAAQGLRMASTASIQADSDKAWFSQQGCAVSPCTPAFVLVVAPEGSCAQ